MYIKKIEIENYKTFNKKTTLDLTPNASGIEKDLEKGFFKKDENNNYISVVNSIGGTNSIGKTTFLNSFFIIKRYFLKMSTKMSLDKFLTKLFKEEVEKEKEGEAYKKTLENIENFEKYINKNKKSNMSSTILEFKKEVISDWYKKEASSIKYPIKIFITFVDYKNEEIIFIFKMNENEESHHFIVNKKYISIKDIRYNELTKKIENIFTKNTFFGNPMNILNESSDANNLLNEIGKDKLLKILNYADSKIIDLTIQETNTEKIKNINEIIIKLNDDIERKVKISDLSQGTKIFINYFLNFWLITKKENSFIFIDEIDSGLHFSLVEFLKLWIQKNNTKNKFSQMFFTSHNINSLSDNLSKKQIFFLRNDKIEDKIIFEKASNNLKPNNSISKKYYEEKIGSHPNENATEEVIDLIMDRIDND